jgi:hypothetical protein
VRHFSMILAVSVLSVAGCMSRSVGDGAPNGNQGRGSSATPAGPGLGAEWSPYEVIDAFVPPPEAVVTPGSFLAGFFARFLPRKVQRMPNGVTTPEAAKVAKGKFDHIHSGMTLRELTDLLGRGWMSQYEGCGIITWTGEDGRQLQVWPTTYRPEEIIARGTAGEDSVLHGVAEAKGRRQPGLDVGLVGGAGGVRGWAALPAHPYPGGNRPQG